MTVTRGEFGLAENPQEWQFYNADRTRRGRDHAAGLRYVAALRAEHKIPLTIEHGVHLADVVAVNEGIMPYANILRIPRFTDGAIPRIHLATTFAWVDEVMGHGEKNDVQGATSPLTLDVYVRAAKRMAWQPRVSTCACKGRCSAPWLDAVERVRGTTIHECGHVVWDYVNNILFNRKQVSATGLYCMWFGHIASYSDLDVAMSEFAFGSIDEGPVSKYAGSYAIPGPSDRYGARQVPRGFAEQFAELGAFRFGADCLRKVNDYTRGNFEKTTVAHEKIVAWMQENLVRSVSAPLKQAA